MAKELISALYHFKSQCEYKDIAAIFRSVRHKDSNAGIDKYSLFFLGENGFLFGSFKSLVKSTMKYQWRHPVSGSDNHSI